ncbi:MAG: TRAP transporter small permease subunit [Desulfobacteraceae bacterium]|nr:MAG: TRAP transporter small permease subunit [Desulfobacteraceae bacterium]
MRCSNGASGRLATNGCPLFTWRQGVQILNAVLRFIDNLNDWVGRVLSLSILLMFVLVLMEVIRRYFFNSPTVWGNELTQLIFGAYVILSGGYILRYGGHVNVDIFYARLSPKPKALLDIITFILFFLFCGMLLIYGGQLAWESLITWEHTQSAWNPPAYPFKLMIPLGAFLLLLQGIAKLIRDILILTTGTSIATGQTAEKEIL